MLEIFFKTFFVVYYSCEFDVLIEDCFCASRFWLMKILQTPRCYRLKKTRLLIKYTKGKACPAAQKSDFGRLKNENLK